MNCCLRQELRTVLASLLLPVILLGACVSPAPSAESVPMPSAAGSPTSSGENELAPIVSAALDFIELLDGQQREAALLPFDSNKRPNWSNLPAGMLPFDRNGVRIGDLRDDQFTTMLAFLSTALSADGLDTVAAVVAAELILADSSSSSRRFLFPLY